MQDFEIPRYKKAVADFNLAFQSAYLEWKQLLADGKAERIGDVDSVFYIDVWRSDVLDGEHTKYIPLFMDAGRQAALATRRQNEAKLDDAWADPDKPRYEVKDKDGNWLSQTLRWVVQLNPQG